MLFKPKRENDTKWIGLKIINLKIFSEFSRFFNLDLQILGSKRIEFYFGETMLYELYYFILQTYFAENTDRTDFLEWVMKL